MRHRIRRHSFVRQRMKQVCAARIAPQGHFWRRHIEQHDISFSQRHGKLRHRHARQVEQEMSDALFCQRLDFRLGRLDVLGSHILQCDCEPGLVELESRFTNRDLGANFDLKTFQHNARYDEREQRIEMHLRSSIDQTVSINGNFTVSLKQGETIWTESSYKFHPEQIRELSSRAGFHCEAQWIDAEWPFVQSLLRAV